MQGWQGDIHYSHGGDNGVQFQNSYLLVPMCYLELTDVMAQSRDYNELLHAWKDWRDVSGKKIRTHYKRYVELSNKAAKLNSKWVLQSLLLEQI